jgi:glyoxylase-like metal-dependent hydrolase (beta-lactamase superfamily II)
VRPCGAGGAAEEGCLRFLHVNGRAETAPNTSFPERIGGGIRSCPSRDGAASCGRTPPHPARPEPPSRGIPPGDATIERTHLGEGVHVLRAAVNCGLVQTDAGLVAIDTGLDRGAANKILRHAEELGLPLAAVVNTHAHADHHGGNAQLVRRTGVPVHAPAVEEAVIRNPGYEPVYLFGGAEPVGALRNRFLQAEPSPVDHVFGAGERITVGGREMEAVDLAGHSLGQVGIRVDGVLFAADAFFGREPLAKHGIPFLVDAGRMRDSLRRLLGDSAAWMVPGHGDALSTPGDTLRENLAVLDRVFGWLADRLRLGPASTEDLLAEIAPAFGLRMDDPSAFVLNRTALLGFLSTLEREGAAAVVLQGGRWLWAGDA